MIPVLISATLALGLVIGYRVQGQLNNSLLVRGFGSGSPLEEVINLVNAKYVDPVERDKLYGDAIRKMMENLDPHSLYISSDELRSVEEEMAGNFEGIGVEFSILNDTIQVVTPLSGGPSEQLGIQAGDKIVKINDSIVAGVGITNLDVMRKLKGPKSTEVKVSIKRGNQPDLIDYTIVRDKIPLHSVDAGFMLDNKTGYIKINRFSAQTYREFMDKALPMKKQGMLQLILDLRQNPGGYLGRLSRSWMNSWMERRISCTLRAGTFLKSITGPARRVILKPPYCHTYRRRVGICQRDHRGRHTGLGQGNHHRKALLREGAGTGTVPAQQWLSRTPDSSPVLYPIGQKHTKALRKWQVGL